MKSEINYHEQSHYYSTKVGVRRLTAPALYKLGITQILQHPCLTFTVYLCLVHEELQGSGSPLGHLHCLLHRPHHRCLPPGQLNNNINIQQ